MKTYVNPLESEDDKCMYIAPVVDMHISRSADLK
jgi:hypothetical protein